MNYIVVSGPDKLSISSFIRFLVSVLGNKYAVGTMHSLMSRDASTMYVESFKNKNPKGIISFYARRKVNVPNPLVHIPDALKSMADVIIWFELYDTNPKVLKISENDSIIHDILIQWNSFISK